MVRGALRRLPVGPRQQARGGAYRFLWGSSSETGEAPLANQTQAASNPDAEKFQLYRADAVWRFHQRLRCGPNPTADAEMRNATDKMLMHANAADVHSPFNERDIDKLGSHRVINVRNVFLAVKPHLCSLRHCHSTGTARVVVVPVAPRCLVYGPEHCAEYSGQGR